MLHQKGGQLPALSVLTYTHFYSVVNKTNTEHYIISKKGGKDQESIQSSTTPDPGYHMGK